MLSVPPSRFAPGLLRHNRRKVTNLGALSAIFLLKNRRKAEFCRCGKNTYAENGRLYAQNRRNNFSSKQRLSAHSAKKLRV